MDTTQHRLGVVGAGTMGNGIAHVFARSGFEVSLYEVNQQALDRGLATVRTNLDREAAKGKIDPAEVPAIHARLKPTLALNDLRDCTLVVEAATERLAIKQQIFRELDALLAPEAILATNTSSISITKLAGGTTRPDRVIGMHFFNPVPLMALVELIRGLQTSDETQQRAEAFVKAIGKTSIVAKNSPGFAVNRILCPMINEAVFALQEGLATAEDIDIGMKLGANHPIGPLALADLIGLDTMLSVMDVFYHGFKDPKYRPAPLLREMVDAGFLGRKSGRGFYRYD